VLLGGAIAATASRDGQVSGAEGARLWVSLYNGPGNRLDSAFSAAVSPDGHSLFVTGRSVGNNTSDDFATVAYDAAAGRQLWASRYNGGRDDTAVAVAVSPDGSRVFVTGFSAGQASGEDFATAGYDASTGKQLWVRRYDGAASGDDLATAIAVAPDNAAVYVTGYSSGVSSGRDYATVAYIAATMPPSPTTPRPATSSGPIGTTGAGTGTTSPLAGG
jgi:hypothetical protein